MWLRPCGSTTACPAAPMTSCIVGHAHMSTVAGRNRLSSLPFCSQRRPTSACCTMQTCRSCPACHWVLCCHSPLPNMAACAGFPERLPTIQGGGGLRHRCAAHQDANRPAEKEHRMKCVDQALQTGLRVVIDCSYVTARQPLQHHPHHTHAVRPELPHTHTSQGTTRLQEQGQQVPQTAAVALQLNAQPIGSSTAPAPTVQHTAISNLPQKPIDAADQRQLVTGMFIGKETRSLAKQIELSAAFNKRSSKPVALTATSYTGALQAFADHMGAAAWPFNTHAQHLLELYPPDQLVLLSPDADTPLLSLDPSNIYVIGGIVDRTVQKGLTAGFAKEHGLLLRRLPVKEYTQQLGLGFPGASTRPVLSVTDVVKALIEFNRTQDWVEALTTALPCRKRRQHGV